MREWFIRGIAAVILLGVLAVSVLFSRAVYQQTRARAILREVASLQPGVATFSDAQSLAGKYGGKPWAPPLQNLVCTAQDCSIVFVFENKMLSALHKERHVSFTVGLGIKDGHVVSKQFQYGLATSSAARFAYILSDHFGPNTFDQEVTPLWVDAAGRSRAVKVELMPSTAADCKETRILVRSCLPFQVARLRFALRLYSHRALRRGRPLHRSMRSTFANVRQLPKSATFLGPTRSLMGGTLAVSQVNSKQPSCQPSWMVASMDWWL